MQSFRQFLCILLIYKLLLLYYWIKTKQTNGSLVQTDTLDVDNATSESSHSYTIVTPTWEGTRTYTYPIPINADPATLDILTNARIQMYWDGETTPSVDVPLGFFYGVGSSGEAKPHPQACSLVRSGCRSRD